MASVDLRLLRYFLAVAEEAHLTKAAERLGIRQPPLSQQIRALEQELGVTLFNRLPRGMELTESGRALLADARNIIALVDQAVDGVRQVSRGEAGRLTVGFTGSAAFHPFVPSVIRRFRDAAPNVRLVLEESSTGELTEAVAEGRVDAAFHPWRPRRQPQRGGGKRAGGNHAGGLSRRPSDGQGPSQEAHRAVGTGRGILHPVPPPQRPWPVRRRHLGLRGRRLQPAHGAGSAAHAVHPEPGGRRPGRVAGAGLAAPGQHRGRGLCQRHPARRPARAAQPDLARCPCPAPAAS